MPYIEHVKKISVTSSFQTDDGESLVTVRTMEGPGPLSEFERFQLVIASKVDDGIDDFVFSRDELQALKVCIARILEDTA